MKAAHPSTMVAGPLRITVQRRILLATSFPIVTIENQKVRLTLPPVEATHFSAMDTPTSSSERARMIHTIGMRLGRVANGI